MPIECRIQCTHVINGKMLVFVTYNTEWPRHAVGCAVFAADGFKISSDSTMYEMIVDPCYLGNASVFRMSLFLCTRTGIFSQCVGR